MKTFEIHLTLEELKLLDGKVSEKAQQVIEEAKKESAYGFDDFPLLNSIIKQSLTKGMLTWTHKSIRSCSFCDKKHDYQVYPRNGRYHRKGEKNWDKPIYYSGIKFNEGFVRVEGLGDMCGECCTKHQVKERLIDYIIDHDLPIQIQKNDYRTSKYLKDDIRICYQCEKEMKESEMTRDQTLMGDGSYPSGCPHCGADSKLFGKSHKVTNKFGMVENPEAKPEVDQLKKAIQRFNETVSKEDCVSLNISKHHPSLFRIQETTFKNGYHTIVSFDVKKQVYEKEYWFKGHHQAWEDILLSAEYRLLEKKKSI